MEDADLAVSLKPEWAKGHLRRGNALKMLRQHEEAFKAFFTCLILEQNVKCQKPVKQELAKELHQLLKTAYSSKNASHCGADTRIGSNSLTGSSETLSVLDTFNVKDLPTCLRELGQHLDVIWDQNDTSEDILTSFGESEIEGTVGNKNWLTLHFIGFF